MTDSLAMTFHAQVRAALAVALLLSAYPQSAAQQPTAKASLRGVVKHARTDQSMAGARISLMSAATQAPPSPRQTSIPAATTETNADGEFVLPNLDPGSYRFTVANNGFVRYDSSRFDLAAGEDNQQSVIRLTATGSVSGRVHNARGRPVPGVMLTLLKRSFNTNGQPSFSTATTARTNDLGEYRMYWVTPGRYYMSVTGRGGANSIAESVSEGNNNEVVEGYVPMFFPGVDDVSKASLVEVVEGMDVRGVDFTVVRQQFLSIRGRVIDAGTGQPPPKASITLYRTNFTGGRSATSGPRGYDRTTGTFELPGLAPGQYGISVTLNDEFLLIQPPVGGGTAWASTTVTLKESDIDGIVLTVAVPPVITGQLKVEGQLPASTTVDRLLVSLTSFAQSFVFFTTPSAAVAADSTFKLGALAEGEYRVTMPGLPAGFYLKEALLNGVDVLRTPTKFSVAGNLEVVISARAGQVDGVVVDDQMRPVPGIGAVLIPNESRDRPELYKRATTNPAGQFTFNNITPGDYKVFSWRSLEANSYFDRETLAPYEQSGTPVHIAESSRETVQVRVIPEARAQ